jgi:hypothetical protein
VALIVAVIRISEEGMVGYKADIPEGDAVADILVHTVASLTSLGIPAEPATQQHLLQQLL